MWRLFRKADKLAGLWGEILNYKKLLINKMLTLQSALEQLEKCSERKFDYSMDHTAQAASTILEVMNRYAAKAVDKLPESFSMSDMSIVLSAFSSFVCMDNTFRYNYGFFQNRIEDYHRYLYSQCVRLDMIVKHYNAVSKCWNLSDVALVYDESYIFECECDEDFVLSLDRRHFVRLYKKEAEICWSINLTPSC